MGQTAAASTGSQWGKHTTRGQSDGKNEKALDPALVEGRWVERHLFYMRESGQGEDFFQTLLLFY